MSSHAKKCLLMTYYCKTNWQDCKFFIKKWNYPGKNCGNYFSSFNQINLLQSDKLELQIYLCTLTALYFCIVIRAWKGAPLLSCSSSGCSAASYGTASVFSSLWYFLFVVKLPSSLKSCMGFTVSTLLDSHAVSLGIRHDSDRRKCRAGLFSRQRRRTKASLVT
jgi:hypothetical protein